MKMIVFWTCIIDDEHKFYGSLELSLSDLGKGTVSELDADLRALIYDRCKPLPHVVSAEDIYVHVTAPVRHPGVTAQQAHKIVCMPDFIPVGAPMKPSDTLVDDEAYCVNATRKVGE